MKPVDALQRILAEKAARQTFDADYLLGAHELAVADAVSGSAT